MKRHKTAHLRHKTLEMRQVERDRKKQTGRERQGERDRERGTGRERDRERETGKE